MTARMDTHRTWRMIDDINSSEYLRYRYLSNVIHTYSSTPKADRQCVNKLGKNNWGIVWTFLSQNSSTKNDFNNF